MNIIFALPDYSSEVIERHQNLFYGRLRLYKFKEKLLLFLTFSVLVANPKKLLYTVANPARGLLNREKRKKKSHYSHVYYWAWLRHDRLLDVKKATTVQYMYVINCKYSSSNLAVFYL